MFRSSLLSLIALTTSACAIDDTRFHAPPDAADAMPEVDARPDAQPDGPDAPREPSISRIWKLLTVAPPEHAAFTRRFTTTAEGRRVLFLLAGTARIYSGASVDHGTIGVTIKVDDTTFKCATYANELNVTMALPACTFFATLAPGEHTVQIDPLLPSGGNPATTINALDRFDLVALEVAPEVELTDLDSGVWGGTSTGLFHTDGRRGLLLASMVGFRPATTASALTGVIELGPSGATEPLTPDEATQQLVRYRDAGENDNDKHLALVPIALPLTRAAGDYQLTIGPGANTNVLSFDPVDALWLEPGDDVTIESRTMHGPLPVSTASLPGHQGPMMLIVAGSASTLGTTGAKLSLTVDGQERSALFVHSHGRRQVFDRTVVMLDQAPPNDFQIKLLDVGAESDSNDPYYITAIYLPPETIVEDVSAPPP